VVELTDDPCDHNLEKCEPPAVPENLTITPAIDLQNGINSTNSQWLSWTYPDPSRLPVAFMIFCSFDNVIYRVAGEVLSNTFDFQNNGTLPAGQLVYCFVRAADYPILERTRTSHGRGADSTIVSRRTSDIFIKDRCDSGSQSCAP
jgi:hypothetical protein